MPKRQYSLKIDKQYRELEHFKQRLNEHLRIVNNSQLSFHRQSPQNYSALPTVRQQKIKIKFDRYSSEKDKYQNSLRTVLFEIRKKMQETTRGEVKSLKTKTYRKPETLSPLKKQNQDLKIKAIDLSLESKSKTINLGRSLQKRQYIKISERHSKQMPDKFIFQPWYYKQDLQYYTFEK